MSTFVDRHRFDFNYIAAVSGSFGDILWRDQAGHDVLWLMNNNTASTIVALPSVPPEWHVKAAAVFDTPGAGLSSADILWQNDNGGLAIWQMNGTTVSAIAALPNPGPTWHVVGDNDFNGDGEDDIFFQNDNGAVAIWSGINAATGDVGITSAGTQNPGPAWHVVGTGDANNDGKAGVLWQNDNGALVIWENPISIGATFTFNTRATLPTVDPTWHVAGMQDITGDGKADVVFQHESGAVVIWEFITAGGQLVSVDVVDLNPGPAWHIAGLRDMNGDTQADILFQNDNGGAAIWEDYRPIGGGMATFDTVVEITPNPNPNGQVWDLL